MIESEPSALSESELIARGTKLGAIQPFNPLDYKERTVPFVSKDILQGRRCKPTMCYKTCKQTCFIWRRLEKRRRDREDERQRASRKLLQMNKDLTNLQGTVVDTYELTGSAAERDPLPEGAVGWCACAFCPLPVYPGDGTFCDFCWPVDDCECGCACQCSGHSEEDEDA